MASSGNTGPDTQPSVASGNWSVYLAVLLIASAVYLGCIVSPPSLMDDVDAAQAQIGRNMVSSGDWVTAHLDGIPYLDKAPAIYWLIASSYKVFGVHDWAARIPVALSAIAVCWLTVAFGIWAFGKRAGFYAGLTMATCIGLFLFTRILLPDVLLTFFVGLALWSLLRTLDPEERRPRLWAVVLAGSLGAGLLAKSVIGVAFPIAAGLIYLFLTGELFSARTWKRLHPFSGALIVIAIAAPWHILATLRNPPYFAWAFHSGPGEYHGFLWHYFVNEQLLRFLNRRYPRDYNTVPRLWFWLLHFVWLFPWAVYLPAAMRNPFKPIDRGSRTRLLALCWVGFVLIFFTFSTTQEYYSMPCYPGLALLLGSAMAAGGDWIRRGTRVLCVVSACAAIAVFAILVYVRGVPTPGDISSALSHHPNAYTLSLGHMQDLTLKSFAYLRRPLVLALIAFVVGAVGTARAVGERAFLAAALMMVLFFHAARIAMVAFDPYLSSRPLAEALMRMPDSKLIVDRHYYYFSSVFFYANRTALLLNGRYNTMEYGSYAPGAPEVFINDAQFTDLWLQSQRCDLVVDASALPRFQRLVGYARLYTLAASGGKLLLTNEPPSESASSPSH